MKRILSLVLILAMAVCLFAACGEQPTNPTVASATVEDAKTYLYAMYKDDDGTIARRDFSLVAAVMIDGVSFPITWTTDAPDYVTIGAAEKNMVKIDIVEEPAEQVNFKLTATLTDAAGNTATVTISRYIEAKKVTGVEFVAAPVVGTAYKYAVQQNNLGQTLYFTGEMSGYYLATSTNPFDAVDVFVEDVDGGQRLYFMKGDVKNYIDVVPRGEDQPGKVNIAVTETPTCVYTWDAERKTFVTNTVADNTWYLGCYSSYNTISASNTSYIEDVTKIGDSQFPAGLCTVNIVPAQVAAPAADTAYKFAVQQNNLGKTLYFTGEMSGYYLATSENPGNGVNIFVEAVEGGYHLYFMKGEVKTYIDVVPRGEDQPGKVNIALTETPTCVFTWDAERKTFTTNTVADNTWYLGCYSSYNTISASNTSYIEKLEVIGESQFPAGPYIVEGFMEMQPEFKEEEPETPVDPVKPTDPAADSKLSVKDALTLGASKDHNVYTEGKYYVSGVITEISNETYGNMKIADAEGNVLTVYGTFNADGSQKYGEMETKPVVGDTITVYGIIGQYNGTPQLKNGWIVKVGAEEASNELTVKEALEMGAAKEHNTYTEDKYYVTGVITEIYNETYGNMKITDAEGNILTVYGTYDADGSNRFDAMATKPVVGDTITVYGILGQYNGTPQMKNGWIVKIGAENELTVKEALEMGAAKEHNTYTEDKYYVTGVITEVYNTTYGNMKITDAEGNVLTVYGTYDADGSNRYDAMATQPVAGDTVTVYGILGQYNGTPQMKNGWIVAHTPAV